MSVRCVPGCVLQVGVVLVVPVSIRQLIGRGETRGERFSTSQPGHQDHFRIEVVAAAPQHVSVFTTTSGSLWLQCHFGLHWINKIIIKTLMLAYKATKGMTPPYLQSLIQPYNPSHSLRSANTGKLSEPSLKHPGQHSTRPRLFSLP